MMRKQQGADFANPLTRQNKLGGHLATTVVASGGVLPSRLLWPPVGRARLRKGGDIAAVVTLPTVTSTLV